MGIWFSSQLSARARVRLRMKMGARVGCRRMRPNRQDYPAPVSDPGSLAGPPVVVIFDFERSVPDWRRWEVPRSESRLPRGLSSRQRSFGSQPPTFALRASVGKPGYWTIGLSWTGAGVLRRGCVASWGTHLCPSGFGGQARLLDNRVALDWRWCPSAQLCRAWRFTLFV